MEHRRRWHWIEWVLIAASVAAAVGNARLYFLNGDLWAMGISCAVCTGLALFLWRRPRSPGNQVMDSILRRLPPKRRNR
jgi:hypothetical protein